MIIFSLFRLKNHIDIEQFIVIFNIDPVVKWTMYVKDNNSPIHYSSIRSYKVSVLSTIMINLILKYKFVLISFFVKINL